MAIPKKDSKIIVVDGSKYRWNVRSKSADSEDETSTGLSFSVKLHEHRGSILMVEMGAEVSKILPSDVSRHIKAAIAAGWDPVEKGKAFVVKA